MILQYLINSHPYSLSVLFSCLLFTVPAIGAGPNFSLRITKLVQILLHIELSGALNFLKRYCNTDYHCLK